MEGEGKAIKVTDRRMFTASGELRDEFRHLEDAPAVSSSAEVPEPPRSEAPAEERPREKLRVEKLGQPEPEFADLISLLAQPASIYLRQAGMAADGSTSESLEMARLHIDLLAVLKEKTAGNLDPQDEMLLDDALAQLRFAYVERRG